jgi:hypothetical protein
MHSKNGIRLLLIAAAVAAPMIAPPEASAGVSFAVSVNIAPPALPVYTQPVCPGPGYLWTPGYWAYGRRSYYWVAGTWVRPPQPGLLWTPAYWGSEGGQYRFHPGYWGPHVGFYGGIRYGFGYPGTGFEGGEWRGREFFYNGAVSHVDAVHMRNVYRRDQHFEAHDAGRRGPYENRGPREDFREHHDNGNHNGWQRDSHDHNDNGNRNGWDREGHGEGHGHDKGDR